jgi:hypothetical protein
LPYQLKWEEWFSSNSFKITLHCTALHSDIKNLKYQTRSDLWEATWLPSSIPEFQIRPRILARPGRDRSSMSIAPSLVPGRIVRPFLTLYTISNTTEIGQTKNNYRNFSKISFLRRLEKSKLSPEQLKLSINQN